MYLRRLEYQLNATHILLVVWKKLKPKLIPVLEKYKVQRLKHECTFHRRQRCQEVLRIIQILADESSQRHEHGKMGASRWPLTYPSGDDLFCMPSIIPLVLENTTPITEETVRVREAAILRDIKSYQARIRRTLAAKVPRISALEPLDTTSDPPAIFGNNQAVSLTSSEVVTDATRLSDKDSIRILSDPTIFFRYPSYFIFDDWALNYPDILQPYLDRNPNDHCDTTMPDVQFHVHATRIAKHIMKSSPTIKNLEQSVLGFEKAGARFVCECCPTAMRKAYSWRNLVSRW